MQAAGARVRGLELVVVVEALAFDVPSFENCLMPVAYPGEPVLTSGRCSLAPGLGVSEVGGGQPFRDWASLAVGGLLQDLWESDSVEKKMLIRQ